MTVLENSKTGDKVVRVVGLPRYEKCFIYEIEKVTSSGFIRLKGYDGSYYLDGRTVSGLSTDASRIIPIVGEIS